MANETPPENKTRVTNTITHTETTDTPNFTEKTPPIERLISDADKIEEALDKFQAFLKRCEQEQFNLTLTKARLADLNMQVNQDTIPGAEAQQERNQIRANFLENLLQFRQQALSGVFDMQGRAEFLASITHRDQVIHEILDQRLLPKRYRRDPLPVIDPEATPAEKAAVKDESKILEGNSSIIYRLYNIDTCRHAIAMVIKTPELDKTFKTEIQRLTDLRHRNVIKLLDHETNRFPYFVVTEFVYGDTLPKALEATGPRPVAQASDWLYQLTEALDYLRHKRILHTNIRPSKIFIDDEWQIMLSPFDLLKIAPAKSSPKDKADDLPQDTSYERTYNRYRDVCQYGSPELLRNDGEGFLQMSEMCVSDLYSIGLIGYKMLTGKDLFEGNLVYDILENRRRFVLDAAYREDRLKLLPESELSGVILELLEEKKATRSSNFPDLHKLLRRLHPLTRLDDPNASEIRKSYRRCLASNKEFIRDFYRRYYTKEGAEIKGFSEISSRRQSAMLQMAVDILLDLDTKKDYLRRLVNPDNAKHGHFGASDFQVFLDAFFDTVAENDRGFWTETLAAEWRKTLDATIDYVRELRPVK